MNQTEPPLVSIVIPTYYRNQELQEAIQGVKNQTYPSVEIIVVDDSGEAHAEPIINQHPEVDYVAFDSNHGANQARTAGFERSSGKYVHFLDDDDYMFERKLERQVELAQRRSSVGVVYCGLEKTGGSINLPNPAVRGDVLEYALMFDMWPAATSSMLIERSLLNDIFPPPDLPGGDDLYLMIELARRTEFEFVDEALLFKRIQKGSRGYSLTAIQGRFEIIEEFEDLYAKHPPHIRNQALAKTYNDFARILLMDRLWSIQAVIAMWNHYYYSSWTDPKAFVKFVAAVFGSPGLRIIRYIGQSSG